MSKFIFVADLHIKLGQKKVPRDWQRNRFLRLAEDLSSRAIAEKANYIVIAGDLLDVAKPSLEEVGLLYDFLSILFQHRVVLIPGNHEMINKKTDCYTHVAGMLDDLGVEVIREFTTLDGIDYIPYNILHDAAWPSPCSDFAITHVRGEIPPHVKPEIDLNRLAGYKKVFTGDLHSYKNSQGNLLYPGSPLTTSFHRTESKGSNGMFIVDSDTGEHEWIELNLPQLIRTKVRDPELMVPTTFHHTIYELEGELLDLAKVGNSELLDKKITNNISTPATLNMTGNMVEELVEFLTEVKDIDEEDMTKYVALFKEIVLDSD